MLKRYFFDSSAFLAAVKDEPLSKAVISLSDSLHPSQKITSVLVAYELYRGVAAESNRRKVQIQILDAMLADFTLKPVHAAQAMAGARVFREKQSKGAIDPILAAQCVDGGYWMVTANRGDFERVPGIKLAEL